MARNRKLLGAVLAVTVVGMTFVGTASAQSTDEIVPETYNTVLGVVDQVVCEALGEDAGDVWECFQAWFCGSDHCIQRKIWSP
jgi:hypothetical protein